MLSITASFYPGTTWQTCDTESGTEFATQYQHQNLLHIIITGLCQLLPWHSLANIRHVFNFENYHTLKQQCSLCIGCYTEFGTQSIMTILSSLFSVNSYPGCKHCLADIRQRRCVFQLQNYRKTNQQRLSYIGYFGLFFWQNRKL